MWNKKNNLEKDVVVELAKKLTASRDALVEELKVELKLISKSATSGNGEVPSMSPQQTYRLLTTLTNRNGGKYNEFVKSGLATLHKATKDAFKKYCNEDLTDEEIWRRLGKS